MRANGKRWAFISHGHYSLVDDSGSQPQRSIEAEKHYREDSRRTFLQRICACLILCIIATMSTTRSYYGNDYGDADPWGEDFETPEMGKGMIGGGGPRAAWLVEHPEHEGITKNHTLQRLGWLLEFTAEFVKEAHRSGDAMLYAHGNDLGQATQLCKAQIQAASEEDLWNLVVTIPEAVPKWLPQSAQHFMARCTNTPIPIIVGLNGLIDMNKSCLEDGMRTAWMTYPDLNGLQQAKFEKGEGSMGNSDNTSAGFEKVNIRGLDIESLSGTEEFEEELRLLEIQEKIAETRLALKKKLTSEKSSSRSTVHYAPDGKANLPLKAKEPLDVTRSFAMSEADIESERNWQIEEDYAFAISLEEQELAGRHGKAEDPIARLQDARALEMDRPTPKQAKRPLGTP